VHEDTIDDTTSATLVSEIECHLHRPGRATNAGHTLHSNRLMQAGVYGPPGRLSGRYVGVSSSNISDRPGSVKVLCPVHGETCGSINLKSASVRRF